MRVFNFGSINIDYVYQVEHFVQPGETLASLKLETVLGGKGANQSVALALAGANVSHLGRIGQSDAWTLEAMQAFGVNTTNVQTLNEPSGHAIIQVDAQGENAIVLHGGANQSFDRSSVATLLSDAQPGDWLLLQNECNALAEIFEEAKKRQLTIAFNPAPMSESVKALPLELCSVLILNEIEASQLAGTADQDKLQTQLLKQYPNTQIVLTLGGAGASVLYRDKKFEAKAPAVSVVDTTGAGDTFVGYYIASQIQGLPIEHALQKACIAGALAVTQPGATPSIPKNADVNVKLNESTL